VASLALFGLENNLDLLNKEIELENNLEIISFLMPISIIET